ncbi:MAG TPA: YihY/virulence factor BrkB family protein [Myxococcota bacterium]|nr:YihY/virulence factor BrkB family protein [Myxococcota bacterium]
MTAPRDAAVPLASPWRLAGLRPLELARRVLARARDDRIADQSAKLSFYFLLSIFPLLYFLTSVFGLVLRGDQGLREMVRETLAAVAPASASELVETVLDEVSRGAGGLQLSIALLATVWTASRGTAAVIEGLNVAYEIGDYRRWWRRNALAIGLTLAFTATVGVAMALLMYGARAAQWAADRLGAGGALASAWPALELLAALAVVLLAFNVLYIVGPNVKNRRWHWLMPGTVAGVGLWLLASYGFKLYLHFFDRYSATYGSIGAVVVLMLWLYLTGISILVGGELNSEIEKAARRGAAPVAKDE